MPVLRSTTLVGSAEVVSDRLDHLREVGVDEVAGYNARDSTHLRAE